MTTDVTGAAMDLDESLLPALLAEMVEVIGIAKVLELVAYHGGTRIRVPRSLDEDHPLARLLGLPAARALAHRYSGEELSIPRAVAAVLATRNAQIARRYRDGETAKALALEYGLTERRIWQLMAELDAAAASRQDSLF